MFKFQFGIQNDAIGKFIPCVEHEAQKVGGVSIAFGFIAHIFTVKGFAIPADRQSARKPIHLRCCRTEAVYAVLHA